MNTDNKGRTKELMTRRSAIAGVGAVAGASVLAASAASAQTQTNTTDSRQEGVREDGWYAGKTAVITGGTSGFGRAVAEELAKLGAKVHFNGRRAELGREVQDGIRAFGGDATFTEQDVKDRAGMKRWIDGIGNSDGGIDFLFANAGIAQDFGPTAELDESHWEEMWQTNVSGIFYAVKDAIPFMKIKGAGSIVMTGSAFGHRGQPGLFAYNANKYAVHGMVRSLALELGPENIRVNGVAPGAVPTTDFGRGNPPLTQEQIDAGNANHGIDRMGETMEIAKGVVWLLGPDASFVAGEILDIDGAFRVG